MYPAPHARIIIMIMRPETTLHLTRSFTTVAINKGQAFRRLEMCSSLMGCSEHIHLANDCGGHKISTSALQALQIDATLQRS